MNKQAVSTNQTRPIYYWLDGYWITDREEAELMDEINAFGSTHGVMYVPENADESCIGSLIRQTLKADEVQLI